MSEQKTKKIADLLLKKGGTVHWEWICDGMDRERANKFLLVGILNYRTKASQIVPAVKRFLATHINDPSSLWEEIISIPFEVWKDKPQEYGLHYLRQAHERVWQIGKRIVEQHGGDASRIWAGDASRKWAGLTEPEVKERLDKLKVGKQISHMIVGALYDTGWINNGGDVKGDTYVTRVVGRVFRGGPITVQETLELTRLMERKNPWLLDKPLFDIGQNYCHSANPECTPCYLRAECCFAEHLKSQL